MFGQVFIVFDIGEFHENLSSRVTSHFHRANLMNADPDGRAVKGVGLRALACWDCVFESRQGRVYIFLVVVLCVVRWRSVRRADHLSRGVLPSVVCLSVISKLRQ
jgi:hypothetical protein